MDIILYSPSNSTGDRLLSEVETVVPVNRIMIFRDIEAFINKILYPVNMHTVIVIFASTKDELMHIVSFKQMFSDHRIILILPNRSDQVISAGHALYPRFLSFADSNFKDIAAVLKKMKERLVTEISYANGSVLWHGIKKFEFQS